MRHLKKLVPLALLLVATCSHGFSTATFTPLPEALRDNPTGAVVAEHDIRLDYTLVATDKGLVPTALVTEKLRVRITGAAGESFAKWPLQAGPHTQVRVARGRLMHEKGDEIAAQMTGSDLVFPSPKPGDLLDIYVERTYDLPQVMSPWLAAERAPTQLWHLHVTAEAGCQVHVAAGTDAAATVMDPQPNGKKSIWDVTLRDIPARETNAPLAAPGPFVVTVLAGYGAPGEKVTDIASSWDAVGAWVDALGQPSRQIGDARMRTLREGVGRAQATNVRQLLKPRLQGGLFDVLPRPFTALEGEGATPLEAATVVAAASSSSMQPAHIALLARSEGFPLLDALPGLYAFTDVLLALPAEGATWSFADPLCGTCKSGEVDFVRSGGRALIVAPQHAQLANVPLSAAAPNRRRLQFEWTLHADGSLQGTLLAELEGASEHAMRQMLATHPKGAEARLEAIQKVLIGQGPKLSGEIAMVSNPYGLRTALGALNPSNDAALKLLPKDIAGQGYLWDLPQTGAALLPGPLDSETVCTVILPAVKDVALPDALSLKGSWGTYAAHFEMQEHYMVYTQTLHLAARWLADADRAALASAVAQIAKAQQQPVMVHLED